MACGLTSPLMGQFNPWLEIAQSTLPVTQEFDQSL